MRTAIVAEAAALADLLGRVLFTHQIDPAHALRALDIDQLGLDTVLAGGELRLGRGDEELDRLRLFANILLRMEVRFRHDSAAIRSALITPIDGLGRIAPIDRFDGSLASLRAVRQAVDQMATPRIRMWRTDHHSAASR